jgi:hypothetical protein
MRPTWGERSTMFMRPTSNRANVNDNGSVTNYATSAMNQYDGNSPTMGWAGACGG